MGVIGCNLSAIKLHCTRDVCIRSFRILRSTLMAFLDDFAPIYSLKLFVAVAKTLACLDTVLLLMCVIFIILYDYVRFTNVQNMCLFSPCLTLLVSDSMLLTWHCVIIVITGSKVCNGPYCLDRPIRE